MSHHRRHTAFFGPAGRIRKNAKPAHFYVDPVTLAPLSAQARGHTSARAQKLVLPKEKITIENVKDVTTLVLLRLRAKTVRATYKRHWECLRNIKPRKFEWTSPEGDGDASSRQEALLSYIEEHLPLIESYANKIRLSELMMYRWKQANRSGGDRHRAWGDLNEAIAAELRRREDEVVHPARADDDAGAQAHCDSQVPKYPLQFAADVARIERECLAGDLGVRKPTVKDKLKAAITNAYESNDIAEAKRKQEQLDRKLALECIRRRAKKARKRHVKRCRDAMNARPQGFDPNSDNDEADVGSYN